RRHTRFSRDWSSDACSSDLGPDESGHYEHRRIESLRTWPGKFAASSVGTERAAWLRQKISRATFTIATSAMVMIATWIASMPRKIGRAAWRASVGEAVQRGS